MKNPAEPGFCCRCTHQPATHSNECQRCHYTTLCMTIVHSIWKESELKDLAEKLSRSTTTQFIDESRAQGAYLRTKLGNTIRRLAFPAGMPADDLKRSVVSAIAAYLGEMEGIHNYEAKPGNEGKYMKHWKSSVSDCLKAIAKKAANA